ncbi:MAG: hypothetical protein HY057_02520, partial [Rhodospirillales bacterium]|nr:hypothetical protein [Rhodospirillales bacterium]
VPLALAAEAQLLADLTIAERRVLDHLLNRLMARERALDPDRRRRQGPIYL